MAVRSTWVTSSASSSASSPGTWLEVRAALLGQGYQVLEDAIWGWGLGPLLWEAGIMVLGTWEEDLSLRFGHPHKGPFPSEGQAKAFRLISLERDGLARDNSYLHSRYRPTPA